jgi:hypothetical protein
VAGHFGQPSLGIGLIYESRIRAFDLAVAAIIGVAAAGVGIIVMRAGEARGEP